MTDQTAEDNLSFLSKPRTVSHEVGGVELEFYPVSIKTLFSTKAILPTVARLLSVQLMDQLPSVTTRSVAHSEEGVVEGSPTVSRTEDTCEAIASSLYDSVLSAKQSSIQGALAVLLAPSSAVLLGTLLLESCGESLELIKGSKLDGPSKFALSLSLPCLLEMLQGVAKANAGVVGKLGALLAQGGQT